MWETLISCLPHAPNGDLAWRPGMCAHQRWTCDLGCRWVLSPLSPPSHGLFEAVFDIWTGLRRTGQAFGRMLLYWDLSQDFLMTRWGVGLGEVWQYAVKLFKSCCLSCSLMSPYKELCSKFLFLSHRRTHRAVSLDSFGCSLCRGIKTI